MANSVGFRASEVRFLQEQNKQILSQLQDVEEVRDIKREVVEQWEGKQRTLTKEYESLERKLENLTNETEATKGEVQQKDEHVRVLSEQNRQLLQMTEEEEQKYRRESAQNETLRDENSRLLKVKDEYNKMEAYTEQQVLYAHSEVGKMVDEKSQSKNEHTQLVAAAQNFSLQARADLQSMEQALGDAKRKNVDYLQTIQRGQVKAHRYEEDLQNLRTQVERVQQRKAQLQAELDGGEAARDHFHRAKAEIDRKLTALEKTAEKLKRSLALAEEGNQAIQDESRQSGEKYRQMADKVYALMDSLRLNQMEVKKQQRDGELKQKKMLELERKSGELTNKVQAEADSRGQAETDMRAAQQMMTLLKKKNRKLEESQVLAQKAQEKAAKRLNELEETSAALTTQNSYLASRVDGQEEDKSALKHEIRDQNQQLDDTQRANQELSRQEAEFENNYSTLHSDKAGLSAELDYIRREDMLDETGRTKPILIQSKQSKLVEKLHINEFLYRSQQSKNPVPMLIEKLSHLLELLHTASTQADVYLQDLSRSNGSVSMLREKNVVLYEKSQLYDAFRTKAQLKFVTNLYQSNDPNLYLDGLAYTSNELSEALRLMYMYNVAEKMTKISFQDNSISDEMVPLVMQFVFSATYLKTVDLRKNNLTEEGIRMIQEQLTQVEGVTRVEGPPKLTDEIRVSSGNQLRLTVLVGQQTKADMARASVLQLDPSLSATDADAFLSSSAGRAGMGTVSTHKPAQQATSLLGSTREPDSSMQATIKPPMGGSVDESQRTLPKLDLSRGGPKRQAPAPPIAKGPGSGRSAG